MYALHIGKLRPKKGTMLSQGHTGARAGRAKFIPRDGHLQAPVLSQLGLFVCLLPRPPHLPSASLDLPLLQPGSALQLRPWAGNNVEQQFHNNNNVEQQFHGLDTLQRPLAATWHAGVLERVVPRLLTLTLPRGDIRKCPSTAWQWPVHCSLTSSMSKLYRL